MKNSKKKISGLLVAIIVVALLLVMVLGLILWLEFGPGINPSGHKAPAAQQTEDPKIPDQNTTGNTDGDNDSDKESEETQKTPVSIDDEQLHASGAIATPYLTLYYDTALVDNLGVVRSTGTPYVLEFYAVLEGKQEQRLFDIVFGVTDGNLGVIKTDAGETTVSMVIYTFQPDESWAQGEIDTILAMQEASNDLIDQLMEYQVRNDYDGPELSTEEPESHYQEYMAIETPYCTLAYPTTWKDYLQTETTETDVYQIDFFGQMEKQDPVLLFTIIFGGDSGEQIGAIQDSDGQYVTVNILMEEMDLSEFSQEDAAILYEMQEALNQLIERLPLE